MSIPFKLIYNSDRVSNVLPSDKRNFNIIRGVNFGIILDYIEKRNVSGIISWINGYENKLTEHLKEYNQLNNIDHGKYCTNLNSILDYIVQGINNLNMSEGFRWIHKVDKGCIDALKKYPSLSCSRDLYSYKDKNLFFKKLMLDLCEDIEYFMKEKNSLKKYKCKKIISRLKYRNETLMKFFRAFYNKSIFKLNNQCSIDFIHKNISNINCNKAKQQTNATVAPSSDSADTRVEVKIKEPTDEEAYETENSQDTGHHDGLGVPGPDDPNLEDLKIGLQFNEDPPKLDTTYAAASLAGISLFGTILYKVKYHYISEILCTILYFMLIQY
ncbi:Pv-fam-c protein [Plasmodium vivax]|uniref:Pv-fam-c protein n=1 Tax=Plasmodium vivax (strain Salvador I) TaxID=126793 RepID=A5KCX0_PLAVS|nr:Pv-fam-c protein [Plasmodium vivax]EDL42797.1 Pv-fam-c protein [Plasmodium vivax]|eukprot:XP_001612588.1 Pv-fam-c protein [Plasmodium vivax Sal-1]